jgi:response regulator RpfG family c-di-GMP phosphodiesterase
MPDREEFDTMKGDTVICGRILNGGEEILKFARPVAVNHHEKWDGSGYRL